MGTVVSSDRTFEICFTETGGQSIVSFKQQQPARNALRFGVIIFGNAWLF